MVTPEVRQPDDPASQDPSPEAGGDGPARVRNTVSGSVGVVVQAGVVHGDVSLHAAPLPPAPVQAPRSRHGSGDTTWRSGNSGDAREPTHYPYNGAW
ncbi:hypothetical protein [Saccharothrix lopnurensis]|uniref:Uncharacterized protein n=1 Tax=Saccharothrix lopnurensis TaxID=1670621 RepID=A0ABW1PEL5_9PSEU